MSKYEVRMVPIRDLEPHPLVQREQPSDTWMERLANDFNPLGVGVLTAIEQKNGKLLLIDGAHRHGAHKILKMHDTEVPVLVYTGLTEQEESLVFVLLQRRFQMSPYDEWRQEYLAGISDAVEVHEMVKERGWKLDKQAGPNSITAIKSLRQLWRKDKAATRWAIDTLTQLYGKSPNTLEAALLKGFFALYRKHGDFITTTKERKIKKLWKDPQALLTRARAQKGQSQTLAASVAFEVRKELNMLK